MPRRTAGRLTCPIVFTAGQQYELSIFVSACGIAEVCQRGLFKTAAASSVLLYIGNNLSFHSQIQSPPTMSDLLQKRDFPEVMWYCKPCKEHHNASCGWQYFPSDDEDKISSSFYWRCRPCKLYHQAICPKAGADYAHALAGDVPNDANTGNARDDATSKDDDPKPNAVSYPQLPAFSPPAQSSEK